MNTFNELLASIPRETAIKMRGVKKCPVAVKAALLRGCQEQGAYIQFSRDIAIDGLRGALMCAQSYEEQGMYAEGTCLDALKKALKVK
jgi:hypothetical protein